MQILISIPVKSWFNFKQIGTRNYRLKCLGKDSILRDFQVFLKTKVYQHKLEINWRIEKYLCQMQENLVLYPVVICISAHQICEKQFHMFSFWHAVLITPPSCAEVFINSPTPNFTEILICHILTL